MYDMDEIAAISERFVMLAPHLDEKGRRLLAAAEAAIIGRGGISLVSRAVGMVRRSIAVGAAELKAKPSDDVGSARIRKPGGGRKKSKETDPTLLQDLETLIEPGTRGDPESPLKWTLKSVRNLADELIEMGHAISYRTVARYLQDLGYSLQGNAKVLEGGDHPDRNAQFEHIAEKVTVELDTGNPVISIDTKKRELIGDFKNGGRELRPKGQPRKSAGT